MSWGLCTVRTDPELHLASLASSDSFSLLSQNEQMTSLSCDLSSSTHAVGGGNALLRRPASLPPPALGSLSGFVNVNKGPRP